MTAIAACLTVRGEADLILQNLRHHIASGVDRIYLFLDGNNKGYKEDLKEFPAVRVFHSDINLVSQNSRLPSSTLLSYQSNHISRQLTHLEIASWRAEAEGLDWLINIDADEFIARDSGPPVRGEVRQFLAERREDVQAVRFRTLEYLPSDGTAGVFENHHFKGSQISGGEGFRLPCNYLAVDDPRVDKLKGLCAIRGRLDWVRHRSSYRLPELDVPLIRVNSSGEGPSCFLDWFLGHTQGKVAMRLHRGWHFKNLLFPSSSRIYDELAQDFYLYHYNSYSTGKCRDKYTAFLPHPEATSLGTHLDPVKQALLQLARQGDWTSFDSLYSSVAVYGTEAIDYVKASWPGAIISVRPIASI